MSDELFKHENKKVIIFAIDVDIAESVAVDNALDVFVFYKDVSSFRDHCCSTEASPLTHVIWVHRSANLRPDLSRFLTIAKQFEFNVNLKGRQYFANLLEPVERIQ